MNNHNRRSNIYAEIIAVIFAITPVAALSQATSANSISFQGALNGANGQPLPNNTYNLTFKFYDSLTNTVPVGVTNVSSVVVTGGVASTPIPVDASWFDGQTRYLGIKINNERELAPRVMLTAVPFAVTALNLSYGEVVVSSDGNVGIGTANPQRTIHVKRSVTPASLALDGHDDGADSTRNVDALMFYRDGAERGGVYWNNDDTLRIFAQIGNRSDGIIINSQGEVGIGSISHGSKFNVEGTTRTKVLQITGGADLAEPFDMTSDDYSTAIVPGMVTVIDREHDGKLAPCTRAYDTAVAGVISGANGLSPGLVMKAEGQPHADGEQPLAMTGRVWCWVDASPTAGGGPVKRGDRLTTSTTFGHAMKVADETKAPGSVVGKALTELRDGRGLVLVLVNLQ